MLFFRRDQYAGVRRQADQDRLERVQSQDDHDDAAAAHDDGEQEVPAAEEAHADQETGR